MTPEEHQIEIDRLRALLLKLSAAVVAMVENHVMGLNLPQELGEFDIAAGNTPEFQAGFRACMDMVTVDYIARIVAVHNQVVTEAKL